MYYVCVCARIYSDLSYDTQYTQIKPTDTRYTTSLFKCLPLPLPVPCIQAHIVYLTVRDTNYADQYTILYLSFLKLCLCL